MVDPKSRRQRRMYEDDWSRPTPFERRRFETGPRFYESEESEERAMGRTRPRRQDFRSGTYEYDYGPRQGTFRGSADDERDWEAGRLRWYDEGERMGYYYSTPTEYARPRDEYPDSMRRESPTRRSAGWQSEDIERPRRNVYGYGGIARRDEERYYGHAGEPGIYARRKTGTWEGRRETMRDYEGGHGFHRSGNWSRNLRQEARGRFAGDIDQYYGRRGRRTVGGREHDELDTVQRMRQPGRGGIRGPTGKANARGSQSRSARPRRGGIRGPRRTGTRTPDVT